MGGKTHTITRTSIKDGITEKAFNVKMQEERGEEHK